MKASLEKLDSIASVHVMRSDPSHLGEYTWTVTFLEDSVGTHRGDMNEFEVQSYLSSGTEVSASIFVSEIRKGTYKEVQKISVSAGGVYVDSQSTFKLRFNGAETLDIPALPIGGKSCLGSTAAKQIITTSSEDTTSQGGDKKVSPMTTFVISYEDFSTNHINANNGTCEETSILISKELLSLPPLREVSVKGVDTGADDGGCVWVVSLLSVVGNPRLMTGKITLLSPFPNNLADCDY